MPSDHRDQVEQLLADYRRSREQLGDVHRALIMIRETARSADGTVSATVGSRGELVDLTIEDTAYQRHRPAELARLVVQVAAAAARSAAGRVEHVLGEALPQGVDPRAVLAGTADLAPEEIAPPAVAAEAEDEGEPRSWLIEESYGR
ncbi:MAG TPA: YbaB/EbfC family nucleoid-associated protein [Pseudonocardiaceae bacterium]